jgi:hypothetical protein
VARRQGLSTCRWADLDRWSPGNVENARLKAAFDDRGGLVLARHPSARKPREAIKQKGTGSA